MPMQSTGNEKFSVYVYFRTRRLALGEEFSKSEDNSSLDNLSESETDQ